MAGDRKRIIGIDLGTTFSAMAYLDRHGTPVTIPNAEGDLTTPSVVLFEPDGSVIVGREARRACLVCPERVAACVKRDIGEKLYSHPVAGKQLSPVSITAFILKKLKQDAEKRIGPIAGIVITVPAYFNEARRQATVDAGTIAGLKVIDIINEPTSAALAYAFRNFTDRGGSSQDLTAMAVSTTAPTTAMVYDLGGGTFDVTILQIEGDKLRVLATDGDVRLGGKEWDERIVNHAAELFIEQHGLDPRQEPQSHQDLMMASEEAKKDLSRRTTAQFAINHAGKHLTVELSRSQFEDMTGDLLYRTESRVDRVIRQAKLTWDDIDEVLLVGGSTRMPQVSAMLRRMTGKEPNITLSADEVVAHGAAIHGAILQVDSGKRGKPAEAIVIDDAIDEDIEILPAADEDDAIPVLLKEYADDSDTSTSESGTFETDGIEATDVFDQDIASILQEVTTVNVNAHSLGLAACSPYSGKEYNSILISRNTPLPSSLRKTYGTVTQDQRFVRVRVLEGESEDPRACITIGECIVAPLPPGLSKGSPISVAFTYDNSGRLHVRAKDETSGLTARATIIRPSAMSKTELAKAQKIISLMPVT